MPEPRVIRSVRVVWEITERFGTMLGDERRYVVTRTGDRVSLTTKTDPSFDREKARELGQALIDAASWEDPGS